VITVREDYYAEYYEFENNNWWFVSRRKIIRALLQRRLPSNPVGWNILDAGCGTGINLALLSQFGKVLGVDCSNEAIRFCHLRNEKNVHAARLEELPFENAAFNLITALDVLEHIENDDQAMREVTRVCAPGGYVLITVPVFPSLWGEHDEVNEHVRRYEPKRIQKLLLQNGFEIIHRSFMNTWLLPAVFFWRWWLKLRRRFARSNNELARPDNMHHHPFPNRILTTIFSSELPLIIRMGLPIGLSFIVLAKKKIDK
jgi:SAM-dependent methyltransferase